MRVLVYSKDLVRVRQIHAVYLLQRGDLWCEIQVHQTVLDIMSYQKIWFEYLGATA